MHPHPGDFKPGNPYRITKENSPGYVVKATVAQRLRLTRRLAAEAEADVLRAALNCAKRELVTSANYLNRLRDNVKTPNPNSRSKFVPLTPKSGVVFAGKKQLPEK